MHAGFVDDNFIADGTCHVESCIVYKSPAFRLIGVGSSLAFWIIGFTLGGRWLDGQVDSDPVLTVLGLVLGLIIGITDAIRRLLDVVRYQERLNRRKNEAKREGQ